MKLLAKFNLVYLLVMSLGIALSGYIARQLLQDNAKQETVASSGLICVLVSLRTASAFSISICALAMVSCFALSCSSWRAI